MSELYGVRALARELGVSHPAVIKAIREGRLAPSATRGNRQLYDLGAARLLWPAEPPPPTEEDDADGGGDDNARYRKARADKEEALAEQEILELARRKSTLLPRDEIAVVFTQYLQVANQAFSGLPIKVLSRFPGLTAEGRDFLTGEMRGILDGLAEWEPGK